MDASTVDLAHPNVARVCVEVDQLKKLPPRVWIYCETYDGLRQDVIYKKLPHYCKHCKRLGREINFYKLAHPELATKPNLKE